MRSRPTGAGQLKIRPSSVAIEAMRWMSRRHERESAIEITNPYGAASAEQASTTLFVPELIGGGEGLVDRTEWHAHREGRALIRQRLPLPQMFETALDH